MAGCGPCGLASALLLARDGHRVTLFERFETPHPLGSGLMIQPTGLAVLAQLGLAERILAEGARIDRLFGIAGGRTVLDVSYRALHTSGLFGIGIHRASLFSVLYDAVRARGITVETGRMITASRADGSGRRLVFAGGAESARFDLVVDALGTHSTLCPPVGHELAYGALWASLAWPPGTVFAANVLAQRYRRSSTMAGVLPIGRGGGSGQMAAFFWSLRADRYAELQSRGLNLWKQEVRALWPDCEPLLAQISDPAQLTFARYSHRSLPAPAQHALIHIGDSWHSASPQLGQGANMALLDAWALAKGLSQCSTIDHGITAAIGLRRSHVRLYQGLSRLLTPVYQSDSRVLPFIRDRLVGPLSKLWPATAIQAAMVSGLIGNPLKPLGLELATLNPAAAH